MPKLKPPENFGVRTPEVWNQCPARIAQILKEY